MQLSFFFGMIMFAVLEVVRTQFEYSYGIEARESIEYVALVSCALFIMFQSFPDKE
jgi:hypothetical protein